MFDGRSRGGVDIFFLEEVLILKGWQLPTILEGQIQIGDLWSRKAIEKWENNKPSDWSVVGFRLDCLSQQSNMDHSSGWKLSNLSELLGLVIEHSKKEKEKELSIDNITFISFSGSFSIWVDRHPRK